MINYDFSSCFLTKFVIEQLTKMRLPILRCFAKTSSIGYIKVNTVKLPFGVNLIYTHHHFLHISSFQMVYQVSYLLIYFPYLLMVKMGFWAFFARSGEAPSVNIARGQRVRVPKKSKKKKFQEALFTF